jgi:hypothetical protein
MTCTLRGAPFIMHIGNRTEGTNSKAFKSKMRSDLNCEQSGEVETMEPFFANAHTTCNLSGYV